MSVALLAFASTFCAVFTLGLQSRFVNTENYWGAGVNSVLISMSHVALYKVMPGSGPDEILFYIAGGVLGITASIWFHKRATAWWQARRARVVRPSAIHRGQVPPKAPPPRATKPRCICGRPEGEPCPRLVCDRYDDEHADVIGSTRLH